MKEEKKVTGDFDLTDWRSFSHIEKMEDMHTYFENRSYDRNFCHYTSLKKIDKILESKTLWISNVNGFNDNSDKEQFGSEEERKFYYALCFSSGVNENLSLWYLYSGIDGKGGRLCFTGKQIEKIIKDGVYCLYDCDGNKVCDLKNRENMEITFRDVLYYRDKYSNISLKYNTMTNYKIKKEDFDRQKAEYKGFLKKLIWYYEKETRLLIKLDPSKVELDPDKNYVIKVDISKQIPKYIRIDLGPEIEKDSMNDELKDYKNILEFIKDSSNLQPSEYAGDLSMDLKKKMCDGCPNKEESKGE